MPGPNTTATHRGVRWSLCFFFGVVPDAEAAGGGAKTQKFEKLKCFLCAGGPGQSENAKIRQMFCGRQFASDARKGENAKSRKVRKVFPGRQTRERAKTRKIKKCENCFRDARRAKRRKLENSKNAKSVSCSAIRKTTLLGTSAICTLYRLIPSRWARPLIDVEPFPHNQLEKLWERSGCISEELHSNQHCLVWLRPRPPDLRPQRVVTFSGYLRDISMKMSSGSSRGQQRRS